MIAPLIESLKSQPRRAEAWRAFDSTEYPKLWDGAAYEPPRSALHEQRLAHLHSLARSLLPRDQAESSRMDADFAHPELPAGYTYFAQNVAHDLSWHRYVREPWRPGRAAPAKLVSLVNRHRPRLDLQMLYGTGPLEMPWLCERKDPDTMCLVKRAYGAGHEWDFVRDEGERALVPDPRQDETVMISQLHVTLIRVHNSLVAALRKLRPGVVKSETTFEAARGILTWHYQWLALNDLLPRILDARRVETLQLCLQQLAKRRPVEFSVFRNREPFFPAEFPFAILRFGHALVRESYRINRSLYSMHLTPPMWPAPGRKTSGAFCTLFRRLPMGWGIDWHLFVPTASDVYQVARRIGPRIAWSHGNLPVRAGEDPRRASLPFLTLRAGWEEPLRFVDGQTAARRHAGMPVVAGAAAPEGGVGNDADPLWTYVLREAETQTGGARLGALGSTVTWQVLVNALLADPDSYLGSAPAWQPFLGETRGRFTLAELVFLPDVPVDELAQRIEAGLA